MTTTPEDPNSRQLKCHQNRQPSSQSGEAIDNLHSSTASKNSEENADHVIIDKTKPDSCHHPLQNTNHRNEATKPTTPPSHSSNTTDHRLKKNHYPSNASVGSVDLDDIFDDDESLASLDENEILHDSTYIRNQIMDSFKLDSTKRVSKFRVLGDDGVENYGGEEEVPSSP
mmetsp:Transcript_25356/g.52525  ORF Transcript_25356/g.52525 Transcript_25356/m.52525 type:complete len:171 (-) Transcript_25356:344-856(-)